MTIEELYEKVGGNYAEAKTRLMNDALIRRFLTKFADTFDIRPLVEAGESGNGKAIFEAVHALKGVAGNLALSKLYGLCADLTEKVRSCQEGAIVDHKDEVKSIVDEFDAEVALIKECFHG